MVKRRYQDQVTYGKLDRSLALSVKDIDRAKLTWNNIASIHSILILNEAEAVHELNLCDLASSMSLEVSLNICLGGIAG